MREPVARAARRAARAEAVLFALAPRLREDISGIGTAESYALLQFCPRCGKSNDRSSHTCTLVFVKAQTKAVTLGVGVGAGATFVGARGEGAGGSVRLRLAGGRVPPARAFPPIFARSRAFVVKRGYQDIFRTRAERASFVVVRSTVLTVLSVLRTS